MRSHQGVAQRRIGGACYWAPAAGLMMLGLLATLLTGCGVTTVTSIGGGSTPGTTGGQTSVTPTATKPAPGTAATPGPRELVARPCPGPYGSVTEAGTPNVVLTGYNPQGTAQAHIGDLVQVRLPISMRWTMGPAPTGMVVISPVGIQDATLNVCAWTFRAQSAGTSILTFTGMNLCDPHAPCAQLAVNVTYAVAVS